MRHKITFHDTHLKRVFWGIASDADAELDADLARSLAGWRAKYQRFKDRKFTPLRMDVRATLEALAKIPNDDADKAVRLLDSETYCRLKNAALLDFRRKFPKPAPIPPGALLIMQAAAGRAELAISPSRLRELATLALSALPKNTGGAPLKNSLDHLFACALVHHWKRINGTEPTACPEKDGGSRFADWATDMFKRVGMPRKDHTKVLQRAIREVKIMG